jgi:hypothetical protein
MCSMWTVRKGAGVRPASSEAPSRSAALPCSACRKATEAAPRRLGIASNISNSGVERDWGQALSGGPRGRRIQRVTGTSDGFRSQVLRREAAALDAPAALVQRIDRSIARIKTQCSTIAISILCNGSRLWVTRARRAPASSATAAARALRLRPSA